MSRITTYFLVLSLCFNFGCSSDSESTTDAMTFDQVALFENLGNNLILPAYRALSQKTNELDLAITEFTDAPDAQKLQNVQEAYVQAYLAWQAASYYEFGPASGENLALSVNTYPTNTSRIEQNVQNNASADNTSDKGFPALDYLFFGISGDESEILEKYNTDDLAENRKSYLKSIMNDLKKRIDNTLSLWNSEYLQLFISKEGNDVGSSLGLFINALLSSYEADLKNAKFGIPAGVSVGLIEPNAQMVEGLYSQKSKELAQVKMNAFIEIFTGRNGIGLDDYVTDLNATSAQGNPLANEILNQLNDAKSQIDNLPQTPLNELITQDKVTVENIYYSLQQAVVYLKTDMTSALSIQVTYQDGDGD